MRTETESAKAAARLQSIARRSTRYEYLVSIPQGTYLLGYHLPISRGRMFELAISSDNIRQVLVRLGNVTEYSKSTYTRNTGWTIGDLRIYRGRTERTAILEGEIDSVSHIVTQS